MPTKPKKIPSKKKTASKPSLPHGPMHRWRPCPIGQHWVREYTKTDATYVRGHCRNNRSHRDQLYPEEMENMAREFFPELKGPPSSNKLGFDEPGRLGDAYDDLVRGWTKYWNDILEPHELLDPNLVKALIASESGFNSASDNKRKGTARARGLMQLTDGTRNILQNEKGELKNHFLTLTDKEAYDPNFNICAGIRWLIYKKGAAEQLEESQDRPALSSVISEDPPWESFNEWQCHPIYRIELFCSAHTSPGYGGRTYEKRIPSLRIIKESGEILDFDYDDFGSFNVDCEATLSEWRRVLDGESVLCLYAAYLQDITEGRTYWILEKVKTSKGYWPISPRFMP